MTSNSIFLDAEDIHFIKLTAYISQIKIYVDCLFLLSFIYHFKTLHVADKFSPVSVQLFLSSKEFYSVSEWMNEEQWVSRGSCCGSALMTVLGLSCGPSPANTIKAASSFQLNIHAGFLDAVHQLPKRTLNKSTGCWLMSEETVQHLLVVLVIKLQLIKHWTELGHVLLWVTWRTR